MERSKLTVPYALASPTSERRRVVILDEDDFELEAIKLVLDHEGFEVSGARRAIDAIELLEFLTPEVCVVAHGVQTTKPAMIFEACAKLVPRSVRVLLTATEESAPSSRSGPRTAYPHVVMAKTDALTELSGALLRALSKQPVGEDSSAKAAARALAERIVIATSRMWPEDVEHCHRVAAWSRRLASTLGLSASRVVDVELGALLHDVGGMNIPEGVHCRPGPLNERDLRLLREHPTRGAELLAGMPLVERAIPVVLCHHERRDGGGYPRGLRGAAIPFEARVFQVVDCYEALVVGRPWKPPVRHEEALAIVRENSGTEFDPEVVDAFVAMSGGEWQRQAA